jgi:hypothetical protein
VKPKCVDGGFSTRPIGRAGEVSRTQEQDVIGIVRRLRSLFDRALRVGPSGHTLQAQGFRRFDGVRGI